MVAAEMAAEDLCSLKKAATGAGPMQGQALRGTAGCGAQGQLQRRQGLEGCGDRTPQKQFVFCLIPPPTPMPPVMPSPTPLTQPRSR